MLTIFMHLWLMTHQIITVTSCNVHVYRHHRSIYAVVCQGRVVGNWSKDHD